jgi:enamine deaminase RidA (YjgF/YER057c/UK114 family)
VRIGQTAAGGAAVFTNHQIKQTKQHLLALQKREGVEAEQIAKLEARQARLEGRAATLETVANASWGDLRDGVVGAGQNITTAASTAGENLSNFKNAAFAQARGVTASVQDTTKSVQNFLGNLMARFSTSQEPAHA